MEPSNIRKFRPASYMYISIILKNNFTRAKGANRHTWDATGSGNKKDRVKVFRGVGLDALTELF